ncbi:DUF4783 domain-containing protein [Chitinophaga sedimenti]|uniref:DUF4783 domain-containing protein n=1 Tax=Chitinophaga sedimenti TaxID=2033606 RepID=UPI00200358C4|nr:DUF4783 domain-containing protein [Chitinophaga sedimenti]MCK7558902.1 DUF4783 domain-containing protein [Chitinophaga sedimenti]
MKKIFFALASLLVVGMFSAFTLFAGPFDDVVGAIKKSDAAGLSRYMDNSIDITIGGKSASYSKAQAEIILKDFFGKNQVKTVEVIHKVESGNGSVMAVANVASGGGNYRTTIYLMKKGNNTVLNELKFENK